MNIDKQWNGDTLTLKISGKLDALTAPDLESSLNEDIDSINSLVMDLSELKYISSAGLRVLLTTQKTMITKGTMIIKNVQKPVMEVFTLTGFVSVLTIE